MTKKIKTRWYGKFLNFKTYIFFQQLQSSKIIRHLFPEKLSYLLIHITLEVKNNSTYQK